MSVSGSIEASHVNSVAVVVETETVATVAAVDEVGEEDEAVDVDVAGDRHLLASLSLRCPDVLLLAQPASIRREKRIFIRLCMHTCTNMQR